MANVHARPQGRPRIWAVGGGKGGVGKTLIASSLAVALARSGLRCIAIDADFGAANLHTHLGVPEPRALLRDFLSGQAPDLNSVACETAVPLLRLVSGARAPAYAANLDHPRRQKLTRHLFRLDAEEVVIDLGAGSGFNALDLFVAADLNLVVVTPELTAIENAYHFVKAAWFRNLRPAVVRAEAREALRLVLGRSYGGRRIAPHDLIDAVLEIDSGAGAELRRAANAFRPGIAVNCVSSSGERSLSHQIAESCVETIGANVRPVGSLSLDKIVHRALGCGQPVLERFPESKFAVELYGVAEQMLLNTPEPHEIFASRPHPNGHLRRALGLDRQWVEKQEQIRRMAELNSGAY